MRSGGGLTVAIVQARMGASRLPGKTLADVSGQPMLSHVVRRARQVGGVDQVVVATSENPADEVIVSFCKERNIACFRGSEDDVLDRYFSAARHFEAEVVVRVTADCPMLDPGVVDRVIDRFEGGEWDYVSNVLRYTYPDGLDTEVLGIETLERAWREATLASDREHVTTYVRNHPTLFRLANVENDEDLSAMRWTVDEPEDLEFVRTVFAEIRSASFGMTEVLRLLGNNPELSEVNSGFRRNAGYLKSLREDARRDGRSRQKEGRS